MASVNSNQHISPQHQRLIGDLVLLLVALIWGSTFVIQRIAAQQGGLYFFNGIRFLVGALVIIPLAILQILKGQVLRRLPAQPVASDTNRVLAAVVLAGLLLSFGSGLQQSGMRFTTAGNAGFITGLYVVLVPFILAIVFRQRLKPVIWLAALMATVGLFMLSLGGSFHINIGDGLVLLGTIFWALHVILISWIVKRLDILVFAAGQFLVCGLSSLVLGIIFEKQSLAEIANLWYPIIFLGVLTIGIGFTLQAFGQRTAPPADAAIILSMETVFAVLSGWIFLSESLSNVQIIGCSIMFLGMLLAQGDVLRPQSKEEMV